MPATTCTAMCFSGTMVTRPAWLALHDTAFRLEQSVELWKWMEEYEKRTGGSVLAIAHNGNLSNGTMFPLIEAFGKKIDKEYVEARAKWERLYETTQTKGTARRILFCRPQTNSRTSRSGTRAIWMLGEKTKEMLQYEYTRSAFKLGLKLEKDLGTNPYKFGLVGSSDAHTGLSAMEENNFFGKVASGEPSPHRLTAAFQDNPTSGIKVLDWEVGSSGYAAVWATANTRWAIWDAMQRKETYATTGPRMTVRFFGGWDFQKADTVSRTPAVVGYAKGVPMGGDLDYGALGKAADLPGGSVEGCHRGQSRPRANREGLDGCQGRPPGEGLRRRLEWRSQAGCGRKGSRRWQHRRRSQRQLYELDRRA